jgi:hypothetical protein
MEGSEYLTDMGDIFERIKHFPMKMLRQKTAWN